MDASAKDQLKLIQAAVEDQKQISGSLSAQKVALDTNTTDNPFCVDPNQPVSPAGQPLTCESASPPKNVSPIITPQTSQTPAPGVEGQVLGKALEKEKDQKDL